MRGGVSGSDTLGMEPVTIKLPTDSTIAAAGKRTASGKASNMGAPYRRPAILPMTSRVACPFASPTMATLPPYDVTAFRSGTVSIV